METNDLLDTKQCALIKALAAAQAEFDTPQKNCVNPAFRSRYADIAAILAAVRPALNKHGLALVQQVDSTPDGVSVSTHLYHVDGGKLSSGVITIPLDRSRNAAQALGSARTYACRYSLASFLGISAEDDDDGNSADGSTEEERKAQRQAPRRAAPRPATKPAPAQQPAPQPEAKPLTKEAFDDLAEKLHAADNRSQLKEAAAAVSAAGVSGDQRDQLMRIYREKSQEFTELEAIASEPTEEN